MILKRLLTIATLNILILFSIGSWASGFAIIEQSVSGLGNAYAGGAAIAEDASTVFFNPAGMTRLGDMEMLAAAHIILPSTKFSDDGGSQDVLGNPLTGGNGGEGGVSAVVPNFYYVQKLGSDLFFGLGVNVPFGLSTKYDSDWQGRYHGIESAIQTLNINPSVAGKSGSSFSWGAGLNVQYLDATLTNAIDTGLIALGAAATQTADSGVKVTGDSIGVGYNLGLLYDIGESTRFGAAYRSGISHDLEGQARFTDTSGSGVLGGLQAGGVFVNSDVTAVIDLPAILSLSLHHDLNPKWSLMGDITWTQWSKFDELVVKFKTGITPDSTETFNWDDSLRYSVGLTFKSSETMVWRGGLALDETPIQSPSERGVRLPGEDRFWTTFGWGYKPKQGVDIEVAYAHLIVSDAKIDNTNATFQTLSGDFAASVDIISVQGRWQF